MALIYLAGYLAGALVAARVFYSVAFDIDYKDSVAKGIEDKDELLKLARHYGMGWSVAGLIWPAVLVVGAVVWVVTRPTPTEKRLAAEEAERAFQAKVEVEMTRLREWHEENKLDAPDTATLRRMAEMNLGRDKK